MLQRQAETKMDSAMADTEETYLATRLDGQIAWFDAKSLSHQRAYKRLRLLEIFAAACIPFVAGISDRHPSLPILLGVLGVVVVIVESVLALNRHQELWTEYRATCEALKGEKFLYEAKAGPYDGEDRFARLVERVESRLQSENAQWAESMRAAAEAEQAARKAQAKKGKLG